MTRQEFVNSIDFWYELIDFCRDMECDVCEEIINGDDLEERIREDFNDYGSEYPWTDIRGWLNDIVEGHDYYVRNGSFEYEYLCDSDFDDYKDSVIEWMDRNGLWDDEDDEWEEVEEDVLAEEQRSEEDDSENLPNEDISVSDLFNVCSGMLQTIKEDKEKAAKEEEEQFARFVCYKKQINLA